MNKKFLNKTSVITSLLLTLSLTTAVPNRVPVKAATTDYTWNNTLPAKYPSAANNNGKLVLFDNSHGETTGQADWVLDGGFSDFADDLVSHGYTVKEYRGVDKNGDGCIHYYDDRQAVNVDSNEAVITYDAIKDADVFVMAEANRPLTISERAALKQFVDSGKGIYFIADHYNADRNMNTWDSTEVYNGYNRSTDTTYNMSSTYGDMRNPQDATKGWLSQNFGLRFRFNAIDLKSGFTGIKSISESEGITNGVKPILMAAGSTLAIVDGSKAKGIVYLGSSDSPTKWSSAADTGLYFGGEKEGAYVAISKPSSGKAAFIGDSSPIEDATPKYKHEGTGATKSTHAGYTSTGTAAALSINIVNWLATKESYVGFDGVNHTKGIATDTPMATVEKTQSQAEPWATPSYNPWNTDTFAYGSYNAPQGPSTGGTTTVSVTGVSLNSTSLTLNTGASQTLTATIAPTNATNKSVTWTSNNTSVATVSNGTVTAISAGTAVITVTTVDGSKTATCTVTVSSSSTGGTGTATAISEGFNSVVGTTSAISSGIPSGWTFSSGMAIYNTSGNYGTSSPSIKMQATGNQITTKTFTIYGDETLSFWVKGNGTDSSSALLIEKYNGSSWSTLSTITALPTTGTIMNYTVPGTTTQLRFTYTKSAGNLALDDINITASNQQVISVTGVTLDSTSFSLNIGASKTLAASVAPSNATNTNVIWSSSNPSVATINNGTVTAISTGTSVITVTTEDGSKTATSTITVASPTGLTTISEGFNSVVGSSSSITSGIPTAWTFTSGMAIYTTSGNYGNSAPSIKMQATGNSITTPTISLVAQGTLSFWIKGNSTDTTSALLVEKFDGTSWTTIANITSLPTAGTTKTYTLPQNTTQVRFTYTKSVGNLALDDIVIS